MDNGHEAATKADLERLRDELTEAIRDRETRLLQAFYSFAESNQKRLMEVERDHSCLKDRVALPENRITDIEKRLKLPPAR